MLPSPGPAGSPLFCRGDPAGRDSEACRPDPKLRHVAALQVFYPSCYEVAVEFGEDVGQLIA